MTCIRPLYAWRLAVADGASRRPFQYKFGQDDPKVTTVAKEISCNLAPAEAASTFKLVGSNLVERDMPASSCRQRRHRDCQEQVWKRLGDRIQSGSNAPIMVTTRNGERIWLSRNRTKLFPEMMDSTTVKDSELRALMVAGLRGDADASRLLSAQAAIFADFTGGACCALVAGRKR